MQLNPKYFITESGSTSYESYQLQVNVTHSLHFPDDITKVKGTATDEFDSLCSPPSDKNRS